MLCGMRGPEELEDPDAVEFALQTPGFRQNARISRIESLTVSPDSSLTVDQSYVRHCGRIPFQSW